MTNEIKEILSLLNSTSWSNEAKQIADYITNLQESYCDYKEKCNEYNVGCIKEILCNYQKTNNNLQQRINKAVEYIEEKQKLNKMFGNITLSKDSQEKLLNILRGDE